MNTGRSLVDAGGWDDERWPQFDGMFMLSVGVLFWYDLLRTAAIAVPMKSERGRSEIMAEDACCELRHIFYTRPVTCARLSGCALYVNRRHRVARPRTNAQDAPCSGSGKRTVMKRWHRDGGVPDTSRRPWLHKASWCTVHGAPDGTGAAPTKHKHMGSAASRHVTHHCPPSQPTRSPREREPSGTPTPIR